MILFQINQGFISTIPTIILIVTHLSNSINLKIDGLNLVEKIMLKVRYQKTGSKVFRLTR